MRKLLILLIVLFSVTVAHAETVDVKYLGQIDLSSYTCPKIKPDEDVKRICFDETKKHLIVRLKKTYYNYCNIPQSAVTDWIKASSLIVHYKKYIITNRRKGRVAYVCPLGAGWINKKIVKPKYFEEVDISSFECPKLKSDKLIHRICYHAATKFMVVLVQRPYYAYCDVGPNVYKSWISASSLEEFYENNIRVSSNGGLYDCRGKEIPEF